MTLTAEKNASVASLQVSSESINISKDVLASAIGSAACVYTGQPFDTIKVRMQCVPADAKGHSSHSISSHASKTLLLYFLL